LPLGRAESKVRIAGMGKCLNIGDEDVIVVKGFGIKGRIVGIESRTRARIRILEGAQIYQTISVEYQDGDLVYP
jgi:hypothetical protein